MLALSSTALRTNTRGGVDFREAMTGDSLSCVATSVDFVERSCAHRDTSLFEPSRLGAQTRRGESLLDQTLAKTLANTLAKTLANTLANNWRNSDETLTKLSTNCMGFHVGTSSRAKFSHHGESLRKLPRDVKSRHCMTMASSCVSHSLTLVQMFDIPRISLLSDRPPPQRPQSRTISVVKMSKDSDWGSILIPTCPILRIEARRLRGERRARRERSADERRGKACFDLLTNCNLATLSKDHQLS